MTSQVYINRLRTAMAHCDELEEIMVEIQSKIESRREVLAKNIHELQQRLDKKPEVVLDKAE